mmetsp:Transcript_24409/g.45443  ORF Transcript_24409/g.45443 Transcript_24409/m.45443 type:complete len:1451 (-) Transcript_24409:165-4517(-)
MSPLANLRSTLLTVLVQLTVFAPAVANVMSWLPRINVFRGSIESEHLGSYDFFDCEGGSSSADPSSDRSCTLNTDSDGDLAVYAGGAGLYLVLGMLAAIIMVLSGLFYLIYSFFKCCCCGCSNHDNKVRDGVNKKCSLLFLICLVFLFTSFCVGTFKGNYTITENTSSEYSVAYSLTGVQNLIHRFEPSATHTALASTSNVMRPTLFVTNRTLNTAISIHELIRAFEIMDTTVPKLPDAHGVVDMLNTTLFIVYNASDYMSLIIVNLEDVDGHVDVMINDTQSLHSQVVELTDIFDDILDTITLLNASIYDTQDLLNSIVGEDGVVANSIDDLKAVQRVDDGGLLPNTNVFDDASTGASGSTQRLLSGAMNGVPVEITAMNDKLIAIKDNVTALPDYSDTADSLVSLNDTINSVLAPNGLISNLTSQVLDLSSLVTEPIPILGNISITISSFEDTLDALLVEMRDSVSIMRTLLPVIESLLPQFEFLDAEVVKLYETDELLPILDIMTGQFESINQTLFVLTDPFYDAIDSIDSVNSTIQDFLHNGTLDKILDQIDDAETTVEDAIAEADDQTNNLDEFLDVLEDSLEKYDIGAINDTVQDALSLLEDIDFDSTLQQIEDFEASLTAINIDTDFVTSLNNLQVLFDQLSSVLATAVGTNGDYILLAQGYCTGRPDVYCETNTECIAVGATTCNVASIGSYRCASPIGSTACTQDSTCTDIDVSSYCLADDARATTLHGVLLGFADDSTDLDVTDILDELESIDLTGDIDLDNALDMVDDAIESIEVFNSTEVLDMIEEVEDGIADVDTASVIDTLKSTQTSIDDVDFDGFLDDIEDNLELYDRVANTTYTDKWIESFETIKDFMFRKDHLRSFLDQLKESVLLEELAAGGPSAAMRHVGRQFDNAYDDIRLNQSGIDMEKLDEPLSERFGDIFEVLDKMGASRYPSTPHSSNDQHGALYYLFALANNFTIGNVQSIPANHPLARGVVANAEGYRYEDPFADPNSDEESKAYCLTAACFEYTINIINTAPMSEISDELFPESYDNVNSGDDDDSSGIDVDLSREEFMTLLWVPVLLLLLIGVLSLSCAFIPRFQKLHVGCNCCFLSCAMLIVPFIFFFSSFFVVLAIIGEDACVSGTAIGESYIKGYGDEYCADVLQGTGTLEDCQFNFTLPDTFGKNENITLNLNILDTYNGLLQEDCGMSVDPFEKLGLDLAEQVQPLASKASDKALDESQYELRPALELIVNSTARNYGQVMYNLIAETNADGTKVMSCESMSLIYSSVEDTGCEGVILPGAWLIASWYFVAWAICCCGIPASCSTLLNYKQIDSDELESSLAESDDVEEMSTDDEEHPDYSHRRLPDTEEYSSDEDEGVEMVAPAAPTEAPSYTAIYRAQPNLGPRSSSGSGASMMSGRVPRSSKESGNSYLDRSASSSQSLGLGVNDSRFQTSRKI